MKILIAADGSDYTKRMLAYLAAHDEWLGAKHCTPSSTASSPSRTAPPRSSAQNVVREFYESDAEIVFRPIRAFFAQQGIEAKYVHTVGHAADSIADLAKEGKFDLVVMGSRGHGDLANLVLGSVATKVLAKCSVPVLSDPLTIGRRRWQIRSILVHLDATPGSVARLTLAHALADRLDARVTAAVRCSPEAASPAFAYSASAALRAAARVGSQHDFARARLRDRAWRAPGAPGATSRGDSRPGADRRSRLRGPADPRRADERRRPGGAPARPRRVGDPARRHAGARRAAPALPGDRRRARR